MSASEFFQSLFEGQNSNEYIQIRFIAPKPKGSRRRDPGITRYAQSVDDLLKILASEAELVQQRNTYFGPALLKAQDGSKESYSRSRVLWGDFDSEKLGGRAGALEAMQLFVLPPSVVIDSGHGYHAYWFIDRWLDQKELETALATIVRTTGSENVGDATRVMRVPGSINQKLTDAARMPVSLARERYDLVYSMQDIFSAGYIEPFEKKLILTAASEKFKSRSERDWSVIIALKRLGMSDDGIRTIFKELPIGDKYRDDGDTYLNRTFLQADESIAKRETAGQDLKVYFSEREGSYWINDGDGTRQVSTFVVHPKRLYISDTHDEDAFLCDVEAGAQTWEDVVFRKSAFNRISDFAGALTSVYWQWLGSDREVRILLPYLVAQWEAKGYSTAVMTSTVGRFGDYWVYDGGALSATDELNSLTSPVVYISSGRVSPPVNYSARVDEQALRDLVQHIAKYLHLINQPQCIWPIIGWFFAAPFKPVLNEARIRFPLLNLYGSKGSGKTSTLLKVMLPIAGYIKPYSQDCSTTHFVLMSYMSSTNAVPIYLTEFRRATLSEREYSSLKRILLQMYDVGHDARGRQNQTTQSYELSAPVILDGEDAIQDAAVMERSVIVTMDPIAIVDSSPAFRHFAKLTERQDLHLIAGKYVQTTLKWSAEQVEAEWQECFDELGKVFPPGVPDRIKRNLATVRFGQLRYVEFMNSYGAQVELPPPDLLCQPLENVVNVKMGRTEMAVDEFVTDIICEVAMDHAVRPFMFRYFSQGNELWFHLTTAYAWWARKRRSEGQQAMTSPAIKSQLKERSEEVDHGPGQYVLGPKAVNHEGKTVWMYGLSLDKCLSCGLDIPSDIAVQYVTLRLAKENPHVSVGDS